MHHSYATVLSFASLVALSSAALDERQTTSRLFGQLPSCPGAVYISGSATSICCIRGSVSIPPLQLSSCAGWPICTGPVTVTPSSTPRDPPLTCATVLDLNDPNYSSMLAAATASIAASGTRAVTTINPTGPAATPGSSASGSGNSQAASTSSTSGGSATGTSARSSATTSAAANSAAKAGLSESAVCGVAVAAIVGAVGLLL